MLVVLAGMFMILEHAHKYKGRDLIVVIMNIVLEIAIMIGAPTCHDSGEHEFKVVNTAIIPPGALTIVVGICISTAVVIMIMVIIIINVPRA
jgi:hypothetical protein